MKKAVIFGVLAALAAAAVLLVNQPDPVGRCTTALPLAVGEPWKVLASEATSDDFGGDCLSEGRADLVRKLTVQRKGRLTVVSDPVTPDLSLALLPADCAAPAAACGEGPVDLDAEVAPGVYHLVVDGPPKSIALTVKVDSRLRLEDLPALEGEVDVKPSVTLTGGCLHAERPSAAFRLDHAGGPVRLQLKGGVNPGALAVRRRCEIAKGEAACVAAPDPVVDLPDLAKGAWCVVAEGDGDRTLSVTPRGHAGTTLPLAIGDTVRLTQGAGPPTPAKGEPCDPGGKPKVAGRFTLDAEAQVQARLITGEGTLSLTAGGDPVCGAMQPPQVSALLPAGTHVVRFEGAAPSYLIEVSATTPTTDADAPSPAPAP